MTEPDVEQNRSLFFSPLGCLFAQCGTVASQAGSEMLSTHPVPSMTAQPSLVSGKEALPASTHAGRGSLVVFL